MGFGMRLKELRLKHGITQKELSELTHIPLQSLVNYENDRREPNAKALIALEKYFNVTGTYLSGDALSSQKSQLQTDNLLDFDASTLTETSQESAAARNKVTSLKPNVVEIVKAFNSLSPSGQEEMLKRMQEYAIIDKQNQKTDKAQKKAAKENDSMATYTIAARDGTWIKGEISKELRDEIRELPGEDLGF